MPSTMRVLVVDDYDDGAQALAVLLREVGCEVSIVNRGRQAIEVAKVFEPHVVVLDLMLPDVNGLDVAAALKEQPWAGRAVFVAYTGVSTRDIVARVERAGFQHFFRKPTPFDDFEAILSRIESSHQIASPVAAGT